MGTREIYAELLLGRNVIALNGRAVGRIEEMRVGDHADITEFHIGRTALLERLAMPLVGRGKRTGYRVPWDKLDLSDPMRPRLKCTVDELKRL